MNAVAACGLQLYTFGQAVSYVNNAMHVVDFHSIVFFTDEWRPDSFYDKIKVNQQAGLHTMCLLGVYAHFLKPN